MSYIGNEPTSVAFLTDTFSGNGSTTAFTMSAAPATTTSILVAVTGVLQDPSTYSVVGTTLTFSAAPPSGTGNISVRYLGIPASGVTTTAYRTITEFTATAGQTTFTPPSYTPGFISVFRNGALLSTTDYTATNGTTVVLGSAASASDLVTIESFYVSSVLNAIPATAGSVGTTYLAGSSVTQAKLGANVAGNGPAFSAYGTAAQSFTSGVWTKVNFDTEDFDTNSNFASSRFTPTVAGYYQINACSSSSGTGNSGWATAIYKNGSGIKYAYIPNASIGCVVFVASVVYLNGSTDYIEIYAINNNTTQNNQVGQAYSYFNGSMVRAA